MSLNVRGNIITSTDITSDGVFKSKINRDGLVLFLDAGNLDSYPSQSIAGNWNDYLGNTANYVVLSKTAIFFKNTTISWVGNFPATVLVTGNYTMSFDYSADAPSTFVVDNDGIMDNAFNVTVSPNQTLQSYSATVNVTSTGSILFYMRRNSGGNINISNFKFYRTDGWDDLSGNSHNATLVNGTAYNSGNGGYFLIDGVDDYVDLGINVYNLGIRRKATFMGWIMSNNGINGGGYLLSDWNGVGMTLRLNSPTSTDFYVYGANHRITYTTTFTSNVWYHMTGVMADDYMYLYVNGVNSANVLLGEDIGNSPSTLKIGNRGDIPGAPPGAGISMVQIYDRILNPYEICENFQATRGRYGV
jgi:hypothetical protein